MLDAYLPHVIHTPEENEAYAAKLEALCSNPHLSIEEQQLVELLTLLIEDFEEKHYALKPSTPLETLAQLMEIHGLKQKDLVASVFGSPGIASEVMNGKRDLSKDHIRKLSVRFHVSPELFF